ncbi:MAG: hypothetical protein NC407_12510, partial [Lachnoclostridium sp.]|nr:hypothetical protein [Lachnoclostridium sp.]
YTNPKAGTVKTPVLRCRILASYVPLRLNRSESVPALDCIFCTTDGCKILVSQLPKVQKFKEGA